MGCCEFHYTSSSLAEVASEYVIYDNLYFCPSLRYNPATTMSEIEKWVSCHRGMFPDAPVSLNTEGNYIESDVTVLIEEAQKHCAQKCPPLCEYRQVIKSIEANKIKLKKS